MVINILEALPEPASLGVAGKGFPGSIESNRPEYGLAATIYDVAKQAGVGIGTFSRAINNSPHHINARTKARILAIASELHYPPHALAQSLARKKTNTIASVVPFFTNYFCVELFKSIQCALSRSHIAIASSSPATASVSG